MRVILLHGKDTDPTQKWYPWLVNEMEKLNIECLAPILPNAQDPNITEWLLELEKTHPDENTILVGHSRGGVAILRYLEKAPKDFTVKKVILVAVNSGHSNKIANTENNKGFFNDKGYNFEKIRLHCQNFVVFHSMDDEWVPFEAGIENTKGLRAKFLQFDDRGHFGKKINTIPELVTEITEYQK